MIKKIKDWFKRKTWDPVRDCAYHRMHGCAHVDGILCPGSPMARCEEYNKSFEKTETRNLNLKPETRNFKP
jgi:hypothetical protein